MQNIRISQLLEILTDSESYEKTVGIVAERDYKELLSYIQNKGTDINVMELKLKDLIFQYEMLGFVRGIRDTVRIIKGLKNI